MSAVEKESLLVGAGMWIAGWRERERERVRWDLNDRDGLWLSSCGVGWLVALKKTGDREGLTDREK